MKIGATYSKYVGVDNNLPLSGEGLKRMDTVAPPVNAKSAFAVSYYQRAVGLAL